MNIVVLSGRIPDKPELRTNKFGRDYAIINLATDEPYYDNNNIRKERTTWHKVIVYDAQARACCKALVKGQMIELNGKMVSFHVKDPDSGNSYKMTQVECHDVVFLAKPRN